MNAAREKVDNDPRGCLGCGERRPSKLDAAHVIDRSLFPGQGFDEPDGVVPLCSRIKGGAGCHDAYDAHRLDILPSLTLDEQAAAVAKVGMRAAFVRTTATRDVENYTAQEGDAWSL